MKADKLDILIGRNNVSLARDCLFFLYLYACVSFSLARSLVYARSFVYSSESRGAFIFSHLSISRRKRERGKRERQRGKGGSDPAARECLGRVCVRGDERKSVPGTRNLEGQ